MDNKILLTKEGIEKLKAERDHLVNVDRVENRDALVLARSQGDLSENADYDAARDEQARIEARIKEIDQMLMHAEVIDESESQSDVVKLGNIVTILDLSEENPEEESYRIVGSTETDPLHGKISNESPLAKAMLDHKVGEVVTVGVASPYDVKIVKISI
ncbi:transcription elongation factor GreA [Intestinibaculum porci]|jgi:transcription elongation factor GreA|uniref:Transcription elongation factor GreA n=1 Tax=Intestinibaculum porci TaxID=2487118 RepID=A0A3G9J5W0_9FIRM|nr:transcription elongation factor GreA [Intestinibaculum porci]MDD6348878.1 transcription elongation factor GreA [Intestinibaculum porci]MDD6423651.1 transcription elongation factor GreA [Intestinibaculum porci]BBH26002.1 transcription elongation factor GreA [Intestinibaculum porci]HAN58855.1 transcription elongation factor GreA [Erysipelotrichaceae bacterium]